MRGDLSKSDYCFSIPAVGVSVYTVSASEGQAETPENSGLSPST